MKPEPLKDKGVELTPEDLGIEEDSMVLSLNDGKAEKLDLEPTIIFKKEDIKSAVEWVSKQSYEVNGKMVVNHEDIIKGFEDIK